MARQFVQVSRSEHAQSAYRPFSNYQHARGMTVAALVRTEMVQASMAMPLAFAVEGEQTALVAVMGLAEGQNLFVAPDGRWVGAYVPAVLRAHPFALAATAEGTPVLVIDEEALVAAGTAGCEPIFAEDGELTEKMAGVMRFLGALQQDEAGTKAAAAALRAAGVIVPWELELKGKDGSRRIEGLNRIDEAALNALPAEQFAALRTHGALAVAHAQMFSMGHIRSFGKLMDAHAKIATPAGQGGQPAGQDLDLEFLNRGGTLSFG